MDKNNSRRVRDFSISGEDFELIYDADLAMWKTTPKPNVSDLSGYYESEDYISHTDASSSLIDKVYQIVKKWMFQYKFRIIQSYNTSGKLLDIGAGTGDFLLEAKKRDWYINGVEPNSSASNLANKKGLNLKYNLSEVSEKYDVITLWHVLEHVYDLEEYLEFLKTHLAPKGTLFIAVPNYLSYDARKYKSHWAAYDVPRHLYHFSKQSIKKLFAEYSLDLVETKPLWFDAIYVSILSEKYKKSKFTFVRGILTGLRSNLSALSSEEYSSQIYILRHRKN